MQRVNKGDLGEVPRKLIERIVNEFPKYGATPREDRLLAMACNPFTVTHLLSDLETQGQLCRKYAPEKFQNLGEGLGDKAKRLLADQIRLVCDIILDGSNGESNAGANEEEDDDDEYDELAAARNEKLKDPNTGSTSRDPVMQEVAKFFNQTFDARATLAGQGNLTIPIDIANLVGVTPAAWIENVHMVAKHFDVMEWWEVTGKQAYPLIYPVACCILALPDSNGGQENLQCCHLDGWKVEFQPE